MELGTVLLANYGDVLHPRLTRTKTLEHGWSRSVLWHYIDTKLYKRQFQAEKTANFNLTLPPPQSDLAREMLKDPYNFDFLTLANDAQEKDKLLLAYLPKSKHISFGYFPIQFVA